MTPPTYTKLEDATREEIDQKLIAAGWVVQDKKRLNLFESLGVAVREMDTDTGPADYMLFMDGKACGIIEAKREDFWATTSNKQLTNSSGTNLNSCFIAGPEGVSLRDETNSFVPKPPTTGVTCEHW